MFSLLRHVLSSWLFSLITLHNLITETLLETSLFLVTKTGVSWKHELGSVSCFVEDTRIFLGMKDEEDTQMIQNDLHKLDKGADTNNRKLNSNKLELLRYGKEQEIKSATTYKSYTTIQILTTKN